MSDEAISKNDNIFPLIFSFKWYHLVILLENSNPPYIKCPTGCQDDLQLGFGLGFVPVICNIVHL